MSECICIDCKRQCAEYRGNYVSDKSYYEWCIQMQKCEKEKEKGGKLND